MSGFPILDLVIGIIFIYFLLSIICSSAVELWLSFRKIRAKLLEEWLRRIFDSQALDSQGNPKVDTRGKPISVGQEIMDHCMVTALAKAGKSTSYISAETFVSALLDKITISPSTKDKTVDGVILPPENLNEYIEAIKNTRVISGELKRIILTLAYEAQAAAGAIRTPLATGIVNSISTTIKSDIDHFRERLENWYDSNGDRLTGTLKRKKVLPITIILAVVITVGINADSIAISKYLYNHKEEAKQFANSAVDKLQYYKDRMETKDSDGKSVTITSSDLNKNYTQLNHDLDSMKAIIPPELPMGWKKNDNWKDHIVGWLATVLAIIMGAPFWFDLLNKIANLRGSGPKPPLSKDKDDDKNKK